MTAGETKDSPSSTPMRPSSHPRFRSTATACSSGSWSSAKLSKSRSQVVVSATVRSISRMNRSGSASWRTTSTPKFE